ncbi:MAG: flagellar protein export ATPase FliI [Gammaproteobacteria bacterium]|nr:flagellar protein export ATPase FliI [Gammaproteobacteria bacterium]
MTYPVQPLQRLGRWHQQAQYIAQHIPNEVPLPVSGRLTRMVGLTLEAEGLFASLGSRCLISQGRQQSEAEVVGFHRDKLYLMPVSEVQGLAPNALVTPIQHEAQVMVGFEMLGRVIDGAGQPLDSKPLPDLVHSVPLHGRRINPLNRDPIAFSLDVGVRTINSLLTVGRGQRLGLFAGTGVGKSILLGMMAKYTKADVVVVGLIGERGREVNEFIRQILGEEGLARSVVVAAPADDPPLRRLHGALRATAIAEFFRDQGLNVLLLMDSLTRYAQAQREIALAVGEPPASKGYPPSVFARIPQLIERAGNGEPGKGSITAFYTVLTEGDDQNDPVADSARGVLDGHFVLSRRIAESGRYPAIDVEASISRVMKEVVSNEQMDLAIRIKRIMALYQQNQDLINVGAYTRGTNPQIDEAIQLQPALHQFLSQKPNESVGMEQSLMDMIQVFKR